jgi:hypothetical protein
LWQGREPLALQAALFLFVKGFRQFKAADAESVSAYIGSLHGTMG